MRRLALVAQSVSGGWHMTRALAVLLGLLLSMPAAAQQVPNPMSKDAADASAPAYNATIAGGGAVAVPVMCDGAVWKAH